MGSDDRIDDLERRMSVAFDGVSADHLALKTTLQCLILSIADARPEILPDLKEKVMHTIGKLTPNDPGGAQHLERHKQLSLLQAEQLFQEMDETVRAASKAQTKTGRRGVN